MKSLLLLICLVFVTVPASWADAALLLEEPFGTYGAMNPTGHAAVYLSRVCAETPTRLRRCLPGEAGVVLSRYHHIAGYDWIAIPLIPYFYAVDDIREIPQAVDPYTVAFLRDDYRRKHLLAMIPDKSQGRNPKGEWGQLIGALYDRKIFAFEIETSETQDDRLIAWLNARTNKSHFNLLFHNCADFTRITMNTYYPGAVHRSLIADAGITTPKQIAKSMVEYSEHHPELRFSAFVVPQVQGTIPRSKPVHGVFESLMKSKKYVVPLAALHPLLASGMFAGYVVGGRFNPARQVDNYDDPLKMQPRLLATTLGTKMDSSSR
jgi:hypothetical protein